MPFTPTRDRVKDEQIDTTPKRRPEWIKVRAPSGETYEWLQEPDAQQGAAHGLRRSHVPEHGRVLGHRHGHLPDDGRCVHALLRLLRYQARPAVSAGLAGAGARGSGGQSDEPQARRHHQRQPGRPQGWRGADLCHGHPAHPPAASRLLDRSAHPRFQGQPGGARRS